MHKLLLADDSVTIQRVIELTFAGEDVRVVSVGDGRQAIREIQTDRPDIVLADVGMPELDGYEVADFVKRTPELSHIPVLLLTGAFEPIDEERARSIGCEGVLVKPFEPQMVITRVKDLLKQRSPAASAPAAPSPRDYGTSQLASLGEFHPENLAPRPAPRATTRPAPSTDEYFDRLDEAFASVEGPQPSQPAVRSAGSATPPMPTLAEAFVALLAAERGRPFESAAAQDLADADSFLDLVTRKVIERLGDERMRDIILDVAERLVREEIERIKRSADHS